MHWFAKSAPQGLVSSNLTVTSETSKFLSVKNRKTEAAETTHKDFTRVSAQQLKTIRRNQAASGSDWLTFGYFLAFEKFVKIGLFQFSKTKLSMISTVARLMPARQKDHDMKPIDLKDLINGLITVIIIAISVGQYGNLREFAKKEFVKSMTSRSQHSTFRIK